MAQAATGLAGAEGETRTNSVERMPVVGVVGFLPVENALPFGLPRFHPLLDVFFARQIQSSLAGGGPDRADRPACDRPPAALDDAAVAHARGIAHILAGAPGGHSRRPAAR
jgi:hypothetical protein